MRVERATFKQLIDLMKSHKLSSDEALECAEQICAIFEGLEVSPESTVHVPNAPSLPLVGKPSMTKEELQQKKEKAAELLKGGIGAPPATGKPGTRVPGGYYDRNSRFVPQLAPVTSTYDSAITPVAPA